MLTLLEINKLDKYLTTRDCIHKSIKNLVKFWHHNHNWWPHLTQMALDIFLILATKVNNK